MARLLSVAPKRQIVLSFTNRVRLDFARTWVAHVRSLNMNNFLIGATDQKALAGLLAAGTPCFSMETNLPQGEWPWGSPSFKALGPHKIELIYKVISWNFEVVITDIDALVLREPFAFMARWPDAAFLTTSDHLGNTTGAVDDGLETHNGIHTAFNIGYMFFRKSALPLVEEWRRVIREAPRTRWDQGEFNRLARQKWDPRSTKGLSDPRLFWSYNKQLIGGVLPLALFAGGHNHFVSQFAQRRGWKPYSVHTTYQYAAAAGKRHRLREGMVWVDPPAYYNPPSGLLSFTLDVPRTLIYPPGGMSTAGHIALINHQLRQIKTALAVAHALGRKLVMPRVVCGYDKASGARLRVRLRAGLRVRGSQPCRVALEATPQGPCQIAAKPSPLTPHPSPLTLTLKAWYPLSSGHPSTKYASKGVFPGAPAYILPIFNCPIDHFLEVGMMAPEETIREHSLLDNPRTPEAVTGSLLTTELRPSGATSGAEIERLRTSFASAKVLNLSHVASIDAMRDVLTRPQAKAFANKFSHVYGSWCCAPR